MTEIEIVASDASGLHAGLEQPDFQFRLIGSVGLFRYQSDFRRTAGLRIRPSEYSQLGLAKALR
jgi:hypothetical protein